MQNPEPVDQPPSRWAPTNKLIGGATIGAAVAQLIVALCNQYLHSPLSAESSSAITILCYAVAAYFIPNKQQ